MDDPANTKPTVPSIATDMKYQPSTSSISLGWRHLLVGEFRDKPDGDIELPALQHHLLLLNLTGGVTSSVRTDGAVRSWRPHPGSITFQPAGVSARWAWQGCPDTMLFLLDADEVSKVARIECDLDPARMALDSQRNIHDAQMLSVLTAIRSELHSGGLGTAMCVESLRTLLSLYLIRRCSAVRERPPTAGRLSPSQLRRVLDYIEDSLTDDLTLSALAGVVALSVHHFARLFKATTGLTPHHFVITRRIERAKLLLPEAETVAEVAAQVGFSDQSHFTRHFKRLVGVTPSNFG